MSEPPPPLLPSVAFLVCTGLLHSLSDHMSESLSFPCLYAHLSHSPPIPPTYLPPDSAPSLHPIPLLSCQSIKFFAIGARLDLAWKKAEIIQVKSVVHHRSRQTPDRCLVLPVRWLSDNCQVPVRCPTRHLSDIYHMYTRHIPDIHQISTRHPSDVHQTSDRHVCYMSVICLVHFWYMSGTCLVHVWYLSDRCLVGVDRCLVGHLTGTWQLSDNHLAGSTRHLSGVWRERWCNVVQKDWFCSMLYSNTRKNIVILSMLWFKCLSWSDFSNVTFWTINSLM